MIDLDLVVAQPGAGGGLQTGPGDADIAGDFAALHRQHALLGALIARDHLQLGAENGVGQHRVERGRAAGAGDDQLLLNRSSKLCTGDVCQARPTWFSLQRAAEPAELPRVELDAAPDTISGSVASSALTAPNAVPSLGATL